MPELPEVDRAVKLIKRVGLGKVIERVEANEDSLVFSETTHTEFVEELTGRKIVDVKRYGKTFYIDLDGEGRLPVLHFGMTGMLQVKGELATYYKETPRKASVDWPPRFMKFILHLNDEETQTTTELAFLDARRLGRIRLRHSPSTEPPISHLGFDPLLCMPSLEDFSSKVLKRSCPIKALLLDQSFSAGVGNWVADEILYHSHVHPEQRCNTLTVDQLTKLHHQVQNVCQVAVAVDADDSKFPDDWLFKHRWGKGKKTKSSLKLASGEPATIKWITVGGRTSAYVAELQSYCGEPPKKRSKRRRPTPDNDFDEDEESELTELTDSDSDEEIRTPSKRQKADVLAKEVTVRVTKTITRSRSKRVNMIK